MILSLETLINAEGKDINLHNNLTLLYRNFPGPLPLLIPYTPNNFCLQLKMALKGCFSHFGKLFSFLGLSHVHRMYSRY